MTDSTSPITAVERLRDAINLHDLETMVACFTAEYESSFPAHPDRAFQGAEQVRPISPPHYSTPPYKETQCGPSGSGRERAGTGCRFISGV
jgi:hypothetical protein